MTATDLLNNPMVQGGIAPLALSLFTLLLLAALRLGQWLAPLAVLAGFAVAAYFVIELTYFPLTSTRKIILAGYAAFACGILFDIIPWPKRLRLTAVFLLGAATATWVLWPILLQKTQWLELALIGGGSALYAGWLCAAVESLRDDRQRVAHAGLALTLGTGVCAVLGASASYGQLGLGAAAAIGAFLLMDLFSERLHAGSMLALGAAGIAALLGVGAFAYAKLPWLSLIALAFVPVMARLPLPARAPRWLRSVVLALYTLPAAGVAVFLAWRIAGPPPV